jgi:hypothetical protein
MAWATLWAIFSKTYLVTLMVILFFVSTCQSFKKNSPALYEPETLDCATELPDGLFSDQKSKFG